MKSVSPLLYATVMAVLLTLVSGHRAFAQSGVGSVEVTQVNDAGPLTGTSGLSSTTPQPSGCWMSMTGRIAGASVSAGSGVSNASWLGDVTITLTNATGSPVLNATYTNVTYDASASRTPGSGYHTYGSAGIFIGSEPLSYAEAGDAGSSSGNPETTEFLFLYHDVNEYQQQDGDWDVFADLHYH